jgi:hypothetical protein
MRLLLPGLLLVGAAISGVGLSTTAARADVTPTILGTNWMAGHGANACNMSSDPTCGGQTHVGGVTDAWWQCVELAQRVFQMNGWYSGAFSGVSYAFDIYNQAAAGNLSNMTAHANGSGYFPVPGDMIVHNKNSAEGADYKNAGHVAVVDYVDSAGVHVVEQNYGGTAHQAVYGLSGSTLSRTLNNGYGQSLPIMGIVHSSLDTLGTQPPPGDSDGDGIVDSADACPSDYGYLSWNWWTGCPDGRESTPYQVSGDFNGDGKADVAVLARSGYPGTNLWVFNGTSSGISSTPTSPWQGTTWYWEGEKVVTGNFNGDSYGDLAILYKSGSTSASISILYGSSSGLTAPSQKWSDNWAWGSLKPVAGDFNGDGKSDIALLTRTGSTSSGLQLFYGTSTGLSSPVGVWGNSWVWENLKPFAGDFNGDGKSDIMMLTRTGTSSSGLQLFYGTSTGLASPTGVWGDSWVWENLKPVAGDFNGDGKADVAILTRTGTTSSGLQVFNGTSTGLSSPVGAWGDSWVWENLKPFAGDFNGDGKADVGMLTRTGATTSGLQEFDGTSTGLAAPVGVWGDNWVWQNLIFS